MIEGTVITTTPVRDLPEYQQPTLENLLKMVNRYGLDNSHTGYKGRPEVYKNFKSLSKDSIVLTGQAYLGQEAFVFLIEGIGYGQFKEDARIHWLDIRGITEEESNGSE